MSKTIDERVVEMRFENQQFEQGIRQSTQSLEMLRQALRVDDAAKSLDSINTAVRNVDMTGLNQNVEQISGRFTRMGIIGDQVLRNIGNGISNIGVKILNTIKSGGLTRAMNIEQAQFQLRGLGVAWDQVSDSINYAVKGTRYGLDEAAVVTSQLIASGVQLGDSMSTSLRAISGVAAMTNREYSDIGQIFTTVASNGKLMTMQLRQLSYSGLNASAVLAKALGKTEAEINDMVSKGQIDFATFAKAMDDAFGEHAKRANETFTGAFANMKAAFARIGAEFWTPLMNGSRDVINSVTPIIDAIKAGLMPAFQAFGATVSSVSAKLSEFLSGVNIEKITADMKGFFQIFSQAFTGNLTDTGGFTALGSTVAGLGALFGILAKVIEAVGRGIGALLVALAPLGNAFLNLTGVIGDFLVWLNATLESSEALQKIFGGIGEALGSVVSTIGSLLEAATGGLREAVSNLDSSPIETFGKSVENNFQPLAVIVEGVKGAFRGLGEGIAAIAPIFERFADGVRSVFDGLGDAIANGNFANILRSLNAGLVTLCIANFMDLGKAGDYLGTMIGRNIAPITANLKTLRATLVAYQTGIQASTMLKIAVAVGILAASLVALSYVDADGLSRGLGAITVIFIELFAAMQLMTKAMTTTTFGSIIKTTILTRSLAISLAILAAALVALGKLDMGQMATALVGLGGSMAILVAGCAGLARINGKMPITAAAMIGLAIALRIMASALTAIGTMDLAQIGKGLAGLGGMMLELMVFLGRGNIAAMTVRAAFALILFGSAMNIMAAALRQIGNMNFDQILKGLAGLGGIMAEIAIFSNLAGGGANFIAIGAGMILVGASLKSFGDALTQIGNLNWGQIAKGLSGLAGSLVAVGVAARIMPPNMPVIGAGLILVGYALQEIGAALTSVGQMSWGELAVGLAALAGSLTILAIAMRAMTSAIPGALALTVMSMGLSLLVPQLMALSTLSLSALGIMLASLAGSFAVFGIAAALLGPVVPIMFALGGAFTLLGVGMAGLGVGLLAISAAIAALAALSAPAFESVKAGIETLAETIPTLMKEVAEGIVETIKTIGERAPEVGEAFLEILKEMVRVFGEAIPEIAEKAVEMVVKIAETIAANTYRLVSAGLQTINSFLAGIRDNIGQVTATATETIIAFMNAMREHFPEILEAGTQLMIDLANDMASTIEAHAGEVGAAAARVGSAIANGVMRGLGNLAQRLARAVKSAASQALEGVKTFLGVNSPSKKFRDEVGKPMVEGTVLGIHLMRKKPGEELVKVGRNALAVMKKDLKIHSPSVVFKNEIGRYIAQGIAEGIEEDDTAEEAAKKKADNIVSAFSKELDRSSLKSDIAKLNYEVWKALNPYAENAEILQEELKYLTIASDEELHRMKLAEDELAQTIDTFGVASKEAMEAQKKMLEIKKSYYSLRQQLSDLDISIEYADIDAARQLREEADELADARLDLVNSEYELWQAMNPDASELDKAKKNLQILDERLYIQSEKIQRMKEDLQDTIAEFGEASKEVMEARTKYVKAQKEYYDLINDKNDIFSNYNNAKVLSADEEAALQQAEQTIKDQELALEEYERILTDLAKTNEKYGFGWSLDEMEAIARKRSGYDKEMLENAKKTRDDLNKKMEEGLEELEGLVDDKLSAVAEMFSKYGIKFADNLNDNFRNTASKLLPATIASVMQAAHGNVIGAAGSLAGGIISSALPGLLGNMSSSGNRKPVRVDSGVHVSSSGSSVLVNSANKVDSSLSQSGARPIGSGSVIVSNNYNMTQNNTSPKALSSSSIFRGTASLFAGMVAVSTKVATDTIKKKYGSTSSKKTSTKRAVRVG